MLEEVLGKIPAKINPKELGIKEAVETEGVNEFDGQFHKRVSGTVTTLTSDLLAGLKPGDDIPESKISPATAAALKGRSVIVNRGK